mmetsp:Transcript_29540/g.78134  ORF Transcript_29540/g.78134 Transcript_29540/m.78134 type:complete len:202 (-) Transcript_29540:1160-1765(-)
MRAGSGSRDRSNLPHGPCPACHRDFQRSVLGHVVDARQMLRHYQAQALWTYGRDLLRRLTGESRDCGASSVRSGGVNDAVYGFRLPVHVYHQHSQTDSAARRVGHTHNVGLSCRVHHEPLGPFRQLVLERQVRRFTFLEERRDEVTDDALPLLSLERVQRNARRHLSQGCKDKSRNLCSVGHLLHIDPLVFGRDRLNIVVS